MRTSNWDTTQASWATTATQQRHQTQRESAILKDDTTETGESDRHMKTYYFVIVSSSYRCLKLSLSKIASLFSSDNYYHFPGTPQKFKDIYNFRYCRVEVKESYEPLRFLSSRCCPELYLCRVDFIEILLFVWYHCSCYKHPSGGRGVGARGNPPLPRTALVPTVPGHVRYLIELVNARPELQVRS